MTLDQARETMRTHGGQIAAWALTRASFNAIAGDLGITGIWPLDTAKLFLIPVVFVGADEPEGVIVRP